MGTCVRETSHGITQYLTVQALLARFAALAPSEH